MMRWIVRTSLQFRFLVVALAVGDDGLRRRRACATCRSTSSPSSRRRGRDPDRAASGCRPRRSRARHDPAWSRRSTAIAGLDVMRSKSSPASRRSSSSSSAAPTAARPASSCRSGWRCAIPALPTWAAPPVILQPLSSTSRVMKIGSRRTTAQPDRPVDDRLLDDPPPADAVPGVANVRSGASACKQFQVQVDPERLRAQRRHARRGHGGRPSDALDCGPAQVHRRRRDRHRRVRRHAEPAARRPPRLPVVRRRQTWPGSRSPIAQAATATALTLGDVARMA